MTINAVPCETPCIPRDINNLPKCRIMGQGLSYRGDFGEHFGYLYKAKPHRIGGVEVGINSGFSQAKKKRKHL